MNNFSSLPLALGLVIFSFLITSILIVPFINILYKFRLLRRKEAPKKGIIPLFDKLHDVKAGTPLGGGILIIGIVVLLFILLFPFASRMGIYIKSSFSLRNEVFVILFTFLSFGALGLADDFVKIFGKPKQGAMGLWVGMKRKNKFILQLLLALFIGFLLYGLLGIKIIFVPLFDWVINLGIFFIPFSAFVIVSFSNAFNITDGLDGLATGLLVICLTVFGVIAAGNLDTPLSLFIALWIGSLIAFLYFNIYPARIIMGDAGALSFGAMLALIGLITGNLIALVVIGGLFVLEILSSLLQLIGWKLYKKPILPLAPLHNSFLARGWEEPKIVMRAWLVAVVLAIFGLWLASI